jgi:RHS repeat-associated protein
MSAGTKSDKANRLTPVESYQYDAGGRRIATTSGTNVVRHVYAGMHVIADTDAAGNLLRSYTWGPGIDKLLSVTVYGPTATNTFNALTDHLGTVHALVTPGGTVVERYEYDAWGNVLGVYDGSGNPLSTSALGNRYLFQGREYSWATHAAWDGAGLYNFRARWYDPLTGRWLSNDPIGIGGGLNQYAFCSNNPVMFVDSTGLEGENEVSRVTGRVTIDEGPRHFISAAPNPRSVESKDAIGPRTYPGQRIELASAFGVHPSNPALDVTINTLGVIGTTAIGTVAITEIIPYLYNYSLISVAVGIINAVSPGPPGYDNSYETLAWTIYTIIVSGFPDPFANIHNGSSSSTTSVVPVTQCP